ncbi:MAG TPA: hypothetical protein VGN57_01450 [Pirellulaceae bacterium]|jgi:hypothetical protein|nr:hypothetical protein [Pirellulaceae bacterium]
MRRKDPDRLTHGQRRKAKARFEAYDAAKNARMGIASLIALLAPPLLFGAWHARRSDEIPPWFSLGSFALAFAGWILYVRHTFARLTREHGLLCEQCGRPLDRWRWPMRKNPTAHPDWRADGTLPKRCPYCRSQAEIALPQTRKRGKDARPRSRGTKLESP